MGPRSLVLGALLWPATVWAILSHPLQNNLMPTKDKISQPFRYLLMSMIWEGQPVNELNVEALQALRSQFPDMRLHHFISPRYFVSSSKAAYKSQLWHELIDRARDKVGLIIHPWSELVEVAQVPRRETPQLWDVRAHHCSYYCGLEVPITRYLPHELEALIKTSQQLLSSANLSQQPVDSVRTGGWLSSWEMVSLFHKLGFRYDFSGVPPVAVRDHLVYYPLYDWLQSRWATTSVWQQAYEYKDFEGLINAGHGGIPVDYVGIHRLLQWFDQFLNEDVDDLVIMPSFHLLFHFDSLFVEQAKIKELLQRMYAHAEKKSIGLRFIVDPVLVKRKLTPSQVESSARLTPGRRHMPDHLGLRRP